MTLDGSKSIRADFVAGSPTNPPVITQQPVSQTLSPGGDATLTVAATGDGPIYYQWRFNDGPLPGATGQALTLTRVSAAQVGRYGVVVTGAAGSTNSGPALIALFDLAIAFTTAEPVPVLTLLGAQGGQYRLESASDLRLSEWVLLQRVTLTPEPFYFVDQPVSDSSKRFYRAVPENPDPGVALRR